MGGTANVFSYLNQMELCNRGGENNPGEKASGFHTLCVSLCGVHFPHKTSLRHPIYIM